MKASIRTHVAVLAIAGFGGACSGAISSGSVSNGAPAPAPAAATPPASAANPADVHFMSAMIHHHAQALIMADLAARHSPNQSIRTLSERIRVSQTDEIALLQQWLRENGAPVPEVTADGVSMPPAGAEHQGHSMSMAGMLSPEQLSALSAARGVEFDRLFLTLMIQHHEGALDMVETLFASQGGGADDFIYKIASDTFADQGSEIDRMQTMLAAMSGSGGI